MPSNIFIPRMAYRPHEYEDILKYVDAINHSFWLVSEWNFTADIKDFHQLSPIQRTIIKNALLAISQIEVSVKKFWAKLGDRFPKSEFDQVGCTFAESEVRHARAYSHLLQLLGLNDDYANLLQVDVIKGRVEYLTKYLRGASDSSDENYSLILVLFALLIENVSLFSQFAIVKAFNKHLNILKDIDNVIQATQQEEQIHAMLGAQIINYIKKENPEWFNEEFYDKIVRACKKAYTAEAAIVDWIFAEGELDFLPKESLKEFIKQRINDGIAMIGGPQVYEVNSELLDCLKWFDEELMGETNNDFFNKRATTYAVKVKPVTEADLWD